MTNMKSMQWPDRCQVIPFGNKKIINIYEPSFISGRQGMQSIAEYLSWLIDKMPPRPRVWRNSPAVGRE
jgi:hypothetical protein